MEPENYLDQLAKSHDRLRTLKGEQKQKREELDAACYRDPSFEEWVDERKNAQEHIKAIKERVAAETGLKADLDELKDNIALEKEVIAGCVERLIAEGKIRSGETLEVGNMTITPKLSVNLNAQMKLL